MLDLQTLSAAEDERLSFPWALGSGPGWTQVDVLAAVDLDVGLVNRVGQDGYTLLIRASMRGHVDLIQGL